MYPTGTTCSETDGGEERGKGREKGGQNRMDKSFGAVTFLLRRRNFPALHSSFDGRGRGGRERGRRHRRLYLLHAGWGGSYAYFDSGRDDFRGMFQ